MSKPLHFESYPPLDTLLTQLFAGELTAEQAVELTNLLEKDNQARELYVLQLNLHAELMWRHTRECAAAKQVTEVQPVSRALAWRFAHSPRILALAAGILFACYFAVISWNMWGREQPGRREMATHESDAPTKPAVAKISDAGGAVWAKESAAKWNEPSVSADEPLKIESGIVRLQLKQGTVMLVEGPAEWSMRDENAVRLKRGKVVASVPPAAVGFLVETASAQIVDMGTEFFVEVNKRGDSDVHVSKGRVVVQPTSGKAKQGVVRLQAGQSAEISPGDSKIRVSPAVPEKFRGLADAADDAPDFKAASDASPETPRSFGVRLQQGAENILMDGVYQGCRDTQLLSWGSHLNFGKRSDFTVGNVDNLQTAHTVIRFDLTPLVGKFSRVTKARLVLHQNPELRVRSPGTANLHVLSVRNRDWTEGAGEFTQKQSTPGATWNQRAPGVRWAGSVGASKSSVDYEPHLLAKHEYEASYSNRPFIFELQGDLDFLAKWATDDSTNAGFLLLGDTSGKPTRISFISSDSPEKKFRPALEIEFEPVPLPSKP